MTNYVCVCACVICTVCSKAQLIGFVYDHFIYKLVKMVVFIVQAKAKLFVTRYVIVGL